MIDTVRIFLPYSLHGDILERLYSRRHVWRDGAGAYRAGLAKNLWVTAREDSTAITGSLATFVNGENLSPFDRGGVSEAIEKMAEEFEVPERSLRESQVMRLDYGVNVDVPEPVGAYIRALGDPPRLLRREYRGKGVTFGGRAREFSVYDKLAEMHWGRAGVRPSLKAEYDGRNVLRAEDRILRRVEDRFGHVVRLGDLDDETFYGSLKGRLVAAYEQVPKLREVATRVPRDVRRLKHELALLGIDAYGGPDAVYASIAEAKAVGDLDRSQAFRLRRWFRETLDTTPTTRKSDLAAELGRLLEAATT